MATGIRLTQSDQNYIMARFLDGQSPACAAMDYIRLNYPSKAKRIDAGHVAEWHRMGLRCIRAVVLRLGWTSMAILGLNSSVGNSDKRTRKQWQQQSRI